MSHERWYKHFTQSHGIAIIWSMEFVEMESQAVGWPGLQRALSNGFGAHILCFADETGARQLDSAMRECGSNCLFQIDWCNERVRVHGERKWLDSTTKAERKSLFEKGRLHVPLVPDFLFCSLTSFFSSRPLYRPPSIRAHRCPVGSAWDADTDRQIMIEPLSVPFNTHLSFAIKPFERSLHLLWSNK